MICSARMKRGMRNLIMNRSHFLKHNFPISDGIVYLIAGIIKLLIVAEVEEIPVFSRIWECNFVLADLVRESFPIAGSLVAKKLITFL